MPTGSEQDLHIERPVVYLDQWVWIRLAKAAHGRPKDPTDVDVLGAVRDASAAGVAFPLSTTHYMELARTANERQRREVAETMAEISYCRTLRDRQTLLRHQMLHAMHIQLGRPAFRPKSPDLLGIGAHWAFTGEQNQLYMSDIHGRTITRDRTLRRLHQGVEARILEGEREQDAEALRRHGYDPQPNRDAERSRLQWEQVYEKIIENGPVTRTEMRVQIQARELIHEHLALLNELFTEYRLDITRAFHAHPDVPGSGRTAIVDFCDRIPSLRIAADLKVELFRDTSKSWSGNSIYDIDALSMAVPYCHVVVPDKQMENLLSRSRADKRNDTIVVAKLSDLTIHLESLKTRAQTLGSDVTGWDALGPGDGWAPIAPP